MGYSLPDIVSWYQKKIGTYDKQPWETTVEQRILSGFTHVPKKTAKLKTDLIDVDLVRGSSFTKVKPKHGIVAITKFALVRLLFLPTYSQWWSQQTSPTLFLLLVFLYLLHICNISIYSYAVYHLPEKTIGRISSSELVIPTAMMVFLAVLHSEIVSSHSALQSSGQEARLPRRHPPPPKRRSFRLSVIGGDKGNDKSDSVVDSAPASAEGCVKFSKRTRPRRMSSEDSSKRRSSRVVWDVSPVKTRLSNTPDLLNEAQDVHIERRGDDEGFESLNSAGSGELSETVDKEAQSWATPAHLSSPGSFSSRVSSGETDHKDSDSDEEHKRSSSVSNQNGGRLLVRRRGSQAIDSLVLGKAGCGGESSYQSSDEGEVCGLTGGCTTSAAEWMGITTNSEDCSDDSLPTTALTDFTEHPFASEFFPSPSSAILSPSCASSDKVSCTMWEKREVKKADLSVLDISSAIIARVEAMPENMDYFYAGMFVSVLLGLVPLGYRVAEDALSLDYPLGQSTGSLVVASVCLPSDQHHQVSFVHQFTSSLYSSLGRNNWERAIFCIAILERILLSGLFFFLLAVAERTFKQKFLYAKFFSHLTSFRRARKSELPHFRLNKVRNIKTWLSVRSYLKKRGPQHSVDVIVSSVFLITLLLLSFLSVELLKDSDRVHSGYNIEALIWCIILGLFLLRFMTLGTKINRKYRNLSVLITEQINLYLQIEQKPNKKEELMVANSVLKLAADLLKELECPYKISGFSANPYLYTITKVVILSALSGVLSEMLGFKLKLHKIKLK